VIKVIFIDIDGPLSYATWENGGVKIMEESPHEFQIPYAWVKEDCDALNEIITQTNALLVVSSDWKKFYTLRQLGFIFEHYGIGKWNIIDTTTHFNPMRKLSSSPEWDRACEIKSWVKTFKPKHWVAIDDMPLGVNFMRLGIPKWRHVQVDGDFGIGGKLKDKVEQTIKLLNK
jgi:hypothetical protein